MLHLAVRQGLLALACLGFVFEVCAQGVPADAPTGAIGVKGDLDRLWKKAKDGLDSAQFGEHGVVQLCRDWPATGPEAARAISAAEAAAQAASAAARSAEAAASSAAAAAAHRDGSANKARTGLPSTQGTMKSNGGGAHDSPIASPVTERPVSCRSARALAHQLSDFFMRVDAIRLVIESDFSDCARRRSAGERSCEALRRRADVERLSSEWLELNMPPPSDAAVREAIEAAPGAYARVEKLKADLGSALSIGDKAAAEALRQYVELIKRRPNNDHDDAVARSLQSAIDAVERAGSASRAHDQARAAADELVAAALMLSTCDGDPSRCPAGLTLPVLQLRVTVAAKRLKNLIDAGTSDYARAKLLRWHALTSDVSGQDQERAIRFLQLQEDNEDARALIGKDAALISASTAESKATLRLSFSETGDESLNRFNLSFSTPLSKSDNTTPLWTRTADGLAGHPAATASWNRFFMPRNKDIAFGSYGLYYKVSQARLSYVDVDDLSALKKLNTRPQSVGLSLIGTTGMKDAPFFALQIERQKTWKQGDTTITCPTGVSTPSINCLQGAVGEPVSSTATVSTAEYRRHRPKGKFDYAVAATYNESTQRFDLFVPLYLFRSSDAGDKARRNSGLSIGWKNKGRGFEIAVFVGAPLSMTSQ